MILKEKSNFDDIEKAAKHFYADYVDGGSAYIRATLSKLGHSDDFIDAVFNSMSDRYDEEELYWDDLDESVNVIYDKDGKTERFYLDFSNPDELYQVLEKHCGYDFATQFRDEFESWKYIEIDEMRECWKADMEEIRTATKDAINTLEKVSIDIMQDITPTLDEMRDIVNDCTDSISQVDSVVDDFFKYGYGSEG